MRPESKDPGAILFVRRRTGGVRPESGEAGSKERRKGGNNLCVFIVIVIFIIKTDSLLKPTARTKGRKAILP
jgi:hypothetical protein